MSPLHRPPLLGALLLSTAALCACADFAPPYRRPPAPVAAAWPTPAAPAASVAAPGVDASDIGWRSFILDERLRQVVALAMQSNRDLRVALLNVQDARAQYRIRDASRWPAVTSDASLTRSKSSGLASNVASVDLGLAGYEIDLFGRVKNASDAALQRYLATTEGARAARIAVVAALATAWLRLAADVQSQRLAETTLALDARSLDLNRRMHELGAIPALPVAQAEAAWQSARGALAAGLASIQLDRDALVLIAGADLPEPWLPFDASPTDAAALVDVPAGLPARVLQRRPDVLAAEHQLQAAQLEIGVARAAWFPAITLTASAGRASPALANLFRSGAGSWSVGPSASLPLFDGGALSAGLDDATAQRDIALASYDKAVQASFAEVADVLAVRSTLADRQHALDAQLEASETVLHEADASWRQGASSYLPVLDAQRSLLAARQAAIALNLTEQQNRIALYKALGGGWKESN